MKKNRSKTVTKVALPKLEDFNHEEMEEIYEFSKAFYNTTAFDQEVERELEKLEAEKKLKQRKVEVIKGGTNTLRHFRPPICMELSPYVLEERGTSAEQLLGELRECGYQLVDLKSRDKITRQDGSLRMEIPNGSSVNVLAYAKTSTL